MKTIFTSILCLFFLLSGYKEAFAQSGHIVPYTLKLGNSNPDSTYYPMAGFNSSAYKEYSYVKESTFMNLRLLFPDGYDSLADDGKEYPLILVLHGAGESALVDWSEPHHPAYELDDPRRYNNDHQLLWGGKEHLDAVRNRPATDERHFPGFVLFPQSSHEGNWVGNHNDMVIEILEILIDSLKIDPLRIYVWGLSNGAKGTWDIINGRPDLFAAALPMSGVGLVDHNRLAHMPIWLFQGSLDTNPRPNGAGKMINDLKRAGGTPRYTLYEGVGHGTWHDAYKEPDFYTWMLQYSELSIHVFENAEFTGQFCGGDAVRAKLGISPGHYAYEWRKVGNTESINNNSNNPHELIVHEIGQYEVRIKRRASDEWTEWSEPVEIKIRDPYTPTLVASGSTTFPSKDGATKVTLSYPGISSLTQWYWIDSTNNINTWKEFRKGSSQTLNTNNRTYYFTATVKDEYGCLSLLADTIAITKNKPQNVITPPSNFSAIPTSETQINLFWQDNSNDEKGFEIYRSEDNGTNFVFVTKTKPNESFFADKSLKANTEYIYDIRAVNFKGSSPYTGEISATTYEDTEAPARPGNLVATSNLDMQSVSLTWEPARDNVGVSEYRVFEVLSNNMLHLIGTTSETNFQVSGLQESTLYTYAVKAIDPSNNLSEASNYASVVTEICGLRYTLYVTDDAQLYNSVNDFLPEHIVGTGEVSTFNIDVRSELVNDIDDYFGFEFEGYLNIAQAGTYQFNLVSDDGSMLWIGDQLIISHDGPRGTNPPSDTVGIYLAADKHLIKVRYFEKTGGQTLSLKYSGPGMSNELINVPWQMLCIDDYSGPPAPSAPSNLIAQAVSENQINLTWTDNSTDEYGFELYRAKSAQGPFELVYTSDENVTAFEDSDLEPNTTYFYKVKAISAQGPSAYSTKEGGIDYEYYEGSWSVLPDFSSLTAVRTGTTSNFGLGLGERANNFGYVFEGNISIPRDGEYIFYTSSDDGSKLYINDEEIVDNDRTHGMQERAGSLYLTEGLHSIRVPYFQGGGGKGLEVRYEGPGINKQLIPNDVLNFVSATTYGDFTDPEAPTNLQVLNKTAYSVGLSWTAATDIVGVTGYIVYSVVNGETQDTLAITDQFGVVIENDNVETTTNSLVAKPFAKVSTNSGMSLLGSAATLPTISTEVKGLDPETSYSVLVKAIDGAGNISLPSNIVSFTTNVDPTNPLPIELVSFNGVAENGIVQLTWKTASEKDNDFFTIERAVNNKIFEAIGEVDGAGNSIIERNYSFEDAVPIIGTLFYRLKQTDFNGDFTYSDIIALQYPTVSSINDRGVDNLILYPNPASRENINLKLEGMYKKAPVSLKIADMLGKVHLSHRYEADDLAKGLKVQTDNKLTPGIYVVIIEQDTQVRKLKLIIEE